MFVCICVAIIIVLPLVGMILSNNSDESEDSGSIYDKMFDDKDHWKFP